MRISCVCSISCSDECFEYFIRILLILLTSDSHKITFSDISFDIEFVCITVSFGQLIFLKELRFENTTIHFI